MAFELRNLSVLAYANGFTLWHYRAAAREVKSVKRQGYFDAAGDMLSAGDIVLISSPGGAGMLHVAAGRNGIATLPLG